jgi:hypothetical protein
MDMFHYQDRTNLFDQAKILIETLRYGFIGNAGAIAYRRLGLQVTAVVLVGGAYLFATDA